MEEENPGAEVSNYQRRELYITLLEPWKDQFIKDR